LPHKPIIAEKAEFTNTLQVSGIAAKKAVFLQRTVKA
jgi:hypothetical protein